MTESLDLSNVCNVVTFSEDNIPGSLYHLALAKRSRVLLLIDKLLTKEKRRLSNLRLAKNLLRNFHSITISIIPPQSDSPLQFVIQLVEEAKKILADPKEPLYNYAQEFMQSIDEKNPSDLEKKWEEFSLHYLQGKLQAAIAQL